MSLVSLWVVRQLAEQSLEPVRGQVYRPHAGAPHVLHMCMTATCAAADGASRSNFATAAGLTETGTRHNPFAASSSVADASRELVLVLASSFCAPVASSVCSECCSESSNRAAGCDSFGRIERETSGAASAKAICAEDKAPIACKMSTDMSIW